MKIRMPVLATGALLALCAGAVQAQAIPALDFARHAEIQSVTLSPGGEYLAMTVPADEGEETQLAVVNLEEGSTTRMSFGKRQHVSDVFWSDNDQIVVSRAIMDPMLAQPISLGELMSTDVAASNREVLFAYIEDRGTKRGQRKDQGFADVVALLRHEPGKVLVRFRCWRWVCGEEQPTVIYKVDTRSGRREEVERIGEPADLLFDQTGRARILTTWDENDLPVLHYRPGSSDEWIPMPKTLAGRSVSLADFAEDGNTAWAIISDHGEPGQLYKVDLAAGTRTRITGRDDVAISYVMYEGPNGPPFAVVYDSDKPTVQYVDPASDWARIHLALLKQFPGQMLSITSATRDGSKMVAFVWSDRNPGSWYLFDRGAGKLQLVGEAMPWIDPAKMASVQPVSFQSRDGKTLYGFLTSAGPGPRPLVVMPHGGPFGPYDSWSFDPQAQFLASRGYSVLQVNYRGSGGRGEAFQQSGWLHWGDMIQDDIADGVRWAIDNHYADAQRICTFGGSFGGYSALMQPILYPDLYRCAAGYAGVYDLNLMRKTDSFSGTKREGRFFDRTLGKDPAKLSAISPSLHVDRIKVPVLLIHGKEDTIANFDQFEAMEDALRAAGRDPETLAVAKEGHGFYKSENRVAMFEELAAFLDKYIGPRATAQASAGE